MYTLEKEIKLLVKRINAVKKLGESHSQDSVHVPNLTLLL